MHLFINYLISLLIVLLIISAQMVVSDLLPTCRPEDFKYDFTECDEFGGRWRVSVPESPKKCVGGAPNAPIRVDKCYTSCDSGHFFNSTSLLCQKCNPGFYSLGGGFKINSFNGSALPSGFHITTETTHSTAICSGWRIESNYIQSLSNYSNGGCVSIITYTVKIVKRGKLRFTYQYLIPEDLASAIVFTFHYRNYDDTGEEDSTAGFSSETYKIKFPSVTNDQKWKTMEVGLPKPGLYVFVWKSVILGHSKTLGLSSTPLHTRSSGIFTGPPGSHSDLGIIKIKSLYVDGVAYASECTPCEAGTYSDIIGSESCSPCPSNTAYPTTGAIKCNPCNLNTEYAPKGSEKCFEKPICGPNDYYSIASECDLSKERQLISYKWIEPKICRDNNNVFPKSHFQECNETTVKDSKSNQICNLGMELREDGKCHFCNDNQYRDETIEKCKQCPPSTSPLYALSFKVWHSGKNSDTSLPEYFATQCVRSEDETEYDCDASIAWQSTPGTEQYIRTGPSTLLRSYLILSLTVPGFRKQTGGEIAFNFEVECSSGDNCQFIFMESKESGKLSQKSSLINQWNGDTTGIQTYRYRIERNVSVVFTWIFKRENSFQSNAKIFEITLTNPMVGSAIKCNPCPHGSGRNCVRCPNGQYLEVEKSDDLEDTRSRNRANSNSDEKCTQCPKNSIVNASLAFPIGRQNSCIPCGPSLADYKGITCYSDCRVNIDGDSFDLTQLKQPLIYKGVHLFTAGGTQYFHLFNITLCGKLESGSICLNNISSFGSSDSSEEEYGIHSMICRSTIIPDSEQTFATQSVSLGDELIGITRATTYKNITVHPEFQTTNSDLHFYYLTKAPTAACPSGRSLTLTVRCAPDLEENVTISTPKECPFGTCDGCNFHLLVKTKTAAACRLCRASDYETVVGECVNGFQQIHFVNPKACILSADGQIPVETRHCSVIPRQVQIGIALVSALGVVLLVLVFHFWKKNRNLEYKYCKLVEGSDKTAECCAEDDEEEENEDQVIIHGKKHKEAYDGGYETIQLTKHNDRNDHML